MYFRFKTLFKITGLLMLVTGIAMIPSLLFAIYKGEAVLAHHFLVSAIISIGAGGGLFFFLNTSVKTLQTRDGYMAVILSWIICSLLGSIPYLAEPSVSGFIDAFFESVSGYTTTGATVLTLHISDPLILWKVTCHWMGGMGILIFIISILPAMGAGGQRIASADSPGPDFAKTSPRTQDFTKSLYIIYLTLTAGETIMLWLGSKMTLFEAIINSMGSISTAGLFMHPQGIAYYDSIYVELVISAFTILASINFITYISLMRGEIRNIFKNIEVRTYLTIITIATLIVTFSLWTSHTYPTFLSSMRHGFFQVTAFATTSGFALTDYGNWPGICFLVFFLLMFIGGCAASTSGSMKVIRIIIAIKLIGRGFYKRRHPRAVRAIRVGRNVIPPRTVALVVSFIFMYIGSFIVSCLVLSLQGLDLETTISSTAGLMSTTGLGFGAVGSSGFFGMFHPGLKLFMTLVMIIGRLEMMSVLLLFFPQFWNPDHTRVRI